MMNICMTIKLDWLHLTFIVFQWSQMGLKTINYQCLYIDSTKIIAMLKREQENAFENTQRVAEAAAQEFQSTINRSLDETKKNVRKSIDESRNQIPQYANVVKNYQEQALESTGKMVEEYVEAQKSVIDSVVSSSAAYVENANRVFNYWYSPRVPVEIWARAVSNVAENVSATTRINNDILFGNIDAFGNAFERVQRQTEELSRINVNNAKIIANTARETVSEFSVNRQSL
jgi:inorganic triphosphatase YgiF